MREYFDKTLVADFPVLYQRRFSPMDQTCMCWGFECGDGWERLIRDLSLQLEFLNENAPVHIVAEQVKEKFGTLRFYVSILEGNKWWADIIYALIDAAESQSSFTCETCGSSYGERRSGGWIRTLCDDCHTKLLESRDES